MLTEPSAGFNFGLNEVGGPQRIYFWPGSSLLEGNDAPDTAAGHAEIAGRFLPGSAKTLFTEPAPEAKKVDGTPPDCPRTESLYA